MEEEEFLKAVPILRDLGPDELGNFLKIARRVRFPRGQTILTEGEPGETMYIIEEGAVEVSKTLVLHDGQEEPHDRDKVLTKLS
ncbi:MAG TPA: cyclic nucleotide-binding domain-containing protein, partial [Thermodesulfobacteriota bacterium]|nr:cyclic nucleotide-binding domain-containing protein [Thermodesulfobacteriota bacterium]